MPRYQLASEPLRGDTFGSGMIDFECQFEAPGGDLEGPVHWYRHKDQPPLAVGEFYDGAITERAGKKKFVVDKRSGGALQKLSGSLSQTAEAAMSASEYQRPKLPSEAAQILRQHSQEMALRFLTSRLGHIQYEHPEQMKHWIDWFDADVRGKA